MSKSVEGRGGAETVSGFTVADVGRMLHRARTRQGLSLRDVSVRIGVPDSLLRAAETGQVAEREGLSTLKTVRRYADFLGLPGDRFALAILEDWPTRGAQRFAPVPAVPEGPARIETGPTAAFPAPVDLSGADPTGVVTGEATGRTQEVPRLAEAASAAPDSAAPPDSAPRDRAARATAPTSAFSLIAPSAESPDVTSTWVPGVFSDTGMAPAVRARSTQIVRRRRHVPAVLQAAIVLVSLAVIAGAAVLAVDRLHPSWLQRIGLIKASPATAARVPAGTSAHATTAASHTSAQSHTSTHSTAPLSVERTSATSGVVDAGAPTFVATVQAVGGPCWIDVTSSTSSSPTYEGTLDAGTTKSFPATTTLVVELGSTSGRLSVSSSAGRLSPTSPGTIPYRLTVHPSH